MGKSKGKKNRSRRRRRPPNNTSPTNNTSNFVSSAGKGCYIARQDDLENDWLIEWQSNVNVAEEFECCNADDIPDVALDPNDYTLSFCNVSSLQQTKVAYITVYETPCRGRNGALLENGSSTNNDGVTRECITFIIPSCPLNTIIHLCQLDLRDGQTIEEVQIDSHVETFQPHPHPNDEHSLLLSFPLLCENKPCLCTQSENGSLTHFGWGNLHAYDFRCTVKTPLVAVANSTVTQVRDHNTLLTGIAVSNLFEWNSILLQVTEEDAVDYPLFVEYVHIQTCNVQEGDTVERGQVIGTSGSVGFSPEPHLHISAFRSDDPKAPTVRVKLKAQDSGEAFVPTAGEYYTANGRVSPVDEQESSTTAAAANLT